MTIYLIFSGPSSSGAAPEAPAAQIPDGRDEQHDLSDTEADLDHLEAPAENETPVPAPQDLSAPEYLSPAQVSDYRALSEHHNFRPALNSRSDIGKLSPLVIFLHFFPVDYLTNVMIPTTNTETPGLDLTKNEFFRWFSLSLIVSMYPAFDREEFFKEPAHKSGVSLNCAPYLKPYMSYTRYEAIRQALRYTPSSNRSPTAPVDKFCNIRDFIQAWNSNMKKNFTPSYIVCLDESMVAWMNRYSCPSWMHVPRKPHPFGNEYHTIACGDTHVIFRVELVEGESKPSHIKLRFEGEYGKTAALLLRMSETIWKSRRVIVLDSGFCTEEGIEQLKEKDLFASVVIKKRRFWPRGMNCEELDRALMNCPVGTVKILARRVGRVPYHIVGLRDSKHVLKLASTYGSFDATGPVKRRRLEDNSVVEFHYPDVVTNYYQCRHAVDDNNNLRQGNVSLEEGLQFNDWASRQFVALSAVSEANALLFYNYHHKAESGAAPLSLGKFRFELAHEMLSTFSAKATSSHSTRSTTSASGGAPGSASEHKIARIPKGHTLANKAGDDFAKCRTDYKTVACSVARCRARIRTTCICDKSVPFCSFHLYRHHIGTVSN